MDWTSKITVIAGIALLTFLVNVPFGYFRKKEKKYSFRWFLFIHIPIPFIILARVSANLTYHVIPVFVLAAVAGQLLGGKIEI